MPEGQENGRAKLTEEKIKEAREIWEIFKGRLEWKEGKNNNHVISVSKLARKYRVAHSTMWEVLTGNTWKSKRRVLIYCVDCNTVHRSIQDRNWKHQFVRKAI